MSSTKIGGEYGEVRANIDGDKLNAYLKAHVPVVATPVAIKQFKVRLLYTRRATCQPSPCAEPWLRPTRVIVQSLCASAGSDVARRCGLVYGEACFGVYHSSHSCSWLSSQFGQVSLC